ncbi:MAG: ATP-dependent Clp protease proteolytic subunit [Candidatus Omnitrophica bacterium]|nr:ATP-dependent Clp protease proteolytic subunit [Candidatus Omnitrophota bacterium]
MSNKIRTNKKTKTQSKKSSQTPNVAKEPKRKIGLTLNWERAIYINKPIDDTLMKELTPVILQMKQKSSDPITVGIDSPGGNVSTMESLLSLLNCPDQDGKGVEIYTVATNRAFSAAASFLAFGDYSVGFPHSNILYHDVRYSDIDDVTPSKALEAARRLERSNAVFSLKLANRVQERLIWVYLDLKPTFSKVRERWKKFVEQYDKVFSELIPKDQQQIVDVVGLSLALYSRLSSPNDQKIAIRALELLASWIQIERIEQRFSKAESEKETDPTKVISSLIDVIKKMDLEQTSPPQVPESTTGSELEEASRNDIRLLLEVLARRLAIDKNQNINDSWLDTVIEDFSFMKDIKSPSHIQATTRMMVNHAHALFDRDTADKIRSAGNEEERNKLLAPFYSQARIFWYYIVLICKCLCRGDHFLTPYDAQLLGLIDEVLGGGLIQSKREWRKTQPNYE